MRLDIEAVAQASLLGDVDALAAFVARNTDSTTAKLAKASGLPKSEIERLMFNKEFRERVTEYLTYGELTPERERKILGRMIAVAESADTDFRDFRDAATWVYRQGGMLKSEKAQVDVSGAIRVAFALDHTDGAGPTEVLDAYVAPDPLAGVVGLRGLPAGGRDENEDDSGSDRSAQASEGSSGETRWIGDSE